MDKIIHSSVPRVAELTRGETTDTHTRADETKAGPTRDAFMLASNS